MHTRIIISCFILAISFKLNQAARSLKCYACGTLPVAGTHNTIHEGCADPFNANSPSVGQSICDGFCKKSEYNIGDRRIVARGCATICFNNQNPDTSCCETDLCNGSTKVYGGSFVIMAASLFLTLCATLLRNNH